MNLTGISLLVLKDARSHKFDFKIIDFNFYSKRSETFQANNILEGVSSLIK
jgi:hypothetical protein